MSLLKTPLYDWHVACGGRMVEFGGWSMPVQYGSIIEEHHATRRAIGIFDVSHMGRFYFSGAGIDTALDRLTTRRVSGIDAGRIRYSLMTKEDGGILDDVLVYHLHNADGQSQYMMVVNASNREKIKAWLLRHLANSGIVLTDRTFDTAMIAVQGPKALGCVAELSSVDPASLKYYSGCAADVAGAGAIVSRTGYTGEDGCELIVDAADAGKIADVIAARAAGVEGRPAGLGARDTLRLEAAMPLYGHELTESINAAQTDLSFAINLKDRDFIGRQAIVAAQTEARLPIRVGLELEGKRAAREGATIICHEREAGLITSGTFAPTLEKSIAMGYLQREFAAPGTDVEVDIRGKRHAARVVKLPFYTRS